MDDIRAFTMHEIDMSKISDGGYEGSCDIGRWALTVKATVKDHRVINVTIVKKMKSIMSDELITEINQNIIEQRVPKFDTVTGASITSKAYLIAITDALHNGMK